MTREDRPGTSVRRRLFAIHLWKGEGWPGDVSAARGLPRDLSAASVSCGGASPAVSLRHHSLAPVRQLIVVYRKPMPQQARVALQYEVLPEGLENTPGSQSDYTEGHRHRFLGETRPVYHVSNRPYYASSPQVSDLAADHKL